MTPWVAFVACPPQPLAPRAPQAAKALIMKDELHARTRVLVRLGFLDDARVVTLKGRAAAEVASADELVATEVRARRIRISMAFCSTCAR